MNEQHADSLQHDLEFMMRKLDETRRELEFEDVVIPYDNGGGQSGIRRNPKFEAYESLLKTYVSALKEYREQAKNKPAREPQLVKFESFAKTMRKTTDA